MKKKTATQTIEHKIAAREQQITTALIAIIDTIEKYFAIAPFEWLNGEDGELGCKAFSKVSKTSFNRLAEWNDHWMGQLFPEAHEAQRQLDARGDAGDAPGELAFAAQEFGFICGILVGCKARGATHDELLDQCEGFILPTMKWERQRITEAAEKQAKGVTPRKNRLSNR